MKEVKISFTPNTLTYLNGNEVKCHEPKQIEKKDRSDKKTRKKV